MVFSREDLDWISSKGISAAQVLEQLELFRRGAKPIRLVRPARAGDGVVQITPGDTEPLISLHDEAAAAGRMIKFVPASGAASRMFKDWYRCCLQGGFDSRERSIKLLRDIGNLAFYDDLKGVISRDGKNLEELIGTDRCSEILEYILTRKGLNYSWLPKALLKFHSYPGHNRTAMEEHLVEAAFYVRDARSVCRIHFTVSEEHESIVKDFFSAVRGRYERQYEVTYEFSLSLQNPATDTIAVDMGNRPYRDRSGRFCFRPGGHGALLQNLNNIDGDIVFLKNIDNVVPDSLKKTTVLYKKILGGYLVQLQDEIFRNLQVLCADGIGDGDLIPIIRFCEERLFVRFSNRFRDSSVPAKREALFQKLNRPIRVCGMVKNEGEAGGGPFWAESEDNVPSLQIVEQQEIDLREEGQKEIWRSATHFNPVDLVCGVRNYRDQKFDLNRYSDRNAVCISQKSQEDAEIKALELPGLWNGSMAFWNTVFVEVPIETFNPVKTVDDLLRKSHLPL